MGYQGYFQGSYQSEYQGLVYETEPVDIGIPNVDSIRAYLEGYGINSSILSDGWIISCRDNEIIPHVEEITRYSVTGVNTVTEYYNGNGQSVMILNRRNITSIVSIEVVGGFSSSNLIQNIELISSEGIIKAKSNYPEAFYGPLFSKGTKNYKVTYTYGDVSPPPLIESAIKLLVCAKLLNIIGSRTGGGSLQVQSHGRNYGTHGKYTDIRKEMVSNAYFYLRKYMTGIVGG